LGHRGSVAETITRRFPFARGRSGAGYLPILAPGRMRARRWSPVEADMTLWRRAPRSVYRVYDEEQYLSGEGEPSSEPGPVGEDLGQTTVPYSSPRTIRLLALGLFAVVTASAAVIVAVGVLSHPKAAPTLGVARHERTHPSRILAVPESTTPAPAVRPGWTAHAQTVVKVGAASATTASAALQQRSNSRSVSPRRRFAAGGFSAVYAPTASAQPSSDVAREVVWGTSEAPLANEARIDGEFGFER
jgi:hypothetical protein